MAVVQGTLTRRRAAAVMWQRQERMGQLARRDLDSKYIVYLRYLRFRQTLRKEHPVWFIGLTTGQFFIVWIVLGVLLGNSWNEILWISAVFGVFSGVCTYWIDEFRFRKSKR